MKEIYYIPKEKYGLIGPRLHFINTVKKQFKSHHIRHKKIYMKNMVLLALDCTSSIQSKYNSFLII